MRSILRISVYELIYEFKIPKKVVLNEYIKKIAKLFFNGEEPSLINAVLDVIFKRSNELKFKTLKEKDFIKKYIKKKNNEYKYSLSFNDDVGVVNNYAYSTDTISEDIHFFKDDGPDTIAKKLIRVNISDLISKGVKPEFCLFNFCSGKLLIKIGWIFF